MKQKSASKESEKYPDFDFEFCKIIEVCTAIDNVNKERIYLVNVLRKGEVLLEYFQIFDNMTIDYQILNEIKPFINNKFINIVREIEKAESSSKKQEIDKANQSYYKYQEVIELTCDLLKVELKKRAPFEYQLNTNHKKHNKEKKSVKSLPWIKIKTSITDVVRIFEEMRNVGIISYKTETKQIAEIFFHEEMRIQKFEKTYNATKNRIKLFHSSSNSHGLFEFTKNLIKSSYAKNGNSLDNLSDYIEVIQKNII